MHKESSGFRSAWGLLTTWLAGNFLSPANSRRRRILELCVLFVQIGVDSPLPRWLGPGKDRVGPITLVLIRKKSSSKFALMASVPSDVSPVDVFVTASFV